MPTRLIRAFACSGGLARSTPISGCVAGKSPRVVAAAGKWRGQARRALPAQRLADGEGHADQHGRQRVIAIPAIEIGGSIGSKTTIHPNDDSTCRNPPTTPSRPPCTLRSSGVTHLIPSIRHLRDELQRNRRPSRGSSSRPDAPDGCGAPHPRPGVLRYIAQLDADLGRIEYSLDALYELAAGGTAVGTGLNTHPEFGAQGGRSHRGAHRLPFVSAPTISPRSPLRTRWSWRAGAPHPGRIPHEDRRRCPLAGLRSEERSRGNAPAGERARIVDHARQGQSHSVPSSWRHRGLRTTPRWPSPDHVQPRAQRLQAGHRFRPPALVRLLADHPPRSLASASKGSRPTKVASVTARELADVVTR